MKNKVQKQRLRIKQEHVLLATFILLIILIICLIALAFNMKSISKKDQANIVIPILEESTESEIGIDVSRMKINETKEYIFKVANHKNNKISEKDLIYNISITSPSALSIKIYKNDSKDSVLNSDDFVIKNNPLPKTNKKTDKYNVIIQSKAKTEDADKITIKINS